MEGAAEEEDANGDANGTKEDGAAVENVKSKKRHHREDTATTEMAVTATTAYMDRFQHDPKNFSAAYHYCAVPFSKKGKKK